MSWRARSRFMEHSIDSDHQLTFKETAHPQPIDGNRSRSQEGR